MCRRQPFLCAVVRLCCTYFFDCVFVGVEAEEEVVMRNYHLRRVNWRSFRRVRRPSLIWVVTFIVFNSLWMSVRPSPVYSVSIQSSIETSPTLVTPRGGANYVIGNGTPTDCTEAAFAAALLQGGRIAFDCGDGATIALTQSYTISRDTFIDGDGTVTLDAKNALRPLRIARDVSVTLYNLRLANGKAPVADGGNGGAILNDGNLIVSNSSFTGGSATNGGAIYSSTTGTLRITNSTFEGNSATAQGGAVWSGSADSKITNSLFVGNRADSGGATYVSAPSTFINNTFTQNSARTNGGAIVGAARLSVTNNTIAANSTAAGGSLYAKSGQLLLQNSIVANSTTGNNCEGTIQNGGGNLQWPGAGCGDLIRSTDPQLGALGDNGGATKTMLPALTSPALHQADSATCPDYDQRGTFRRSSVICDSGAIEQTTPIYVDATPPPPSATAITDCTETNLKAAVATGGLILINCKLLDNPAPPVIIPATAATPTEAALKITKDTVIIGGYIGYGAIGGGQVYRIDGGNANRIFDVAAGVSLTLQNISVRNGKGVGGGAITLGTGSVLRLNYVTLENNSSTGDGGAILNNGGRVEAFQSLFVGNSATNNGGAIYSQGGSVTIGDGQFKANTAATGGAIYSQSPTLVFRTLFGSRYSQFLNSAGTGGAIYASNLTLRDSALSNNTAGSGAAIATPDGATVTLENTVVSQNTAPSSGAITGGGTFAITNVTFFSNAAANGALNIPAAGSATLTNVTFAANTGGAIVNNGNVTVRNSIITGNTGTNCSGTITNGGHNLNWPNDGSCGTIPATDPQLDVDPNDSYNGGLTWNEFWQQTLVPKAMATFHQGDSLYCPATDQRGATRQADQACDIGAYETFPGETGGHPDARVVGNGSAESCTANAFHAAIDAANQNGGTISFACGDTPHTINMGQRAGGRSAENIDAIASVTNIVVDGGNRITLSGGDSTSLFFLSNVALSVTLKNITIADTYSDLSAIQYDMSKSITGTLTFDTVAFLNNISSNACSIARGANATATNIFLLNSYAPFHSSFCVSHISFDHSLFGGNVGGAFGDELVVHDSYFVGNSGGITSAICACATANSSATITASTFSRHREANMVQGNMLNISDSVIRRNEHAPNNGSAIIYLFTGTIENSVFSNNVAKGSKQHTFYVDSSAGLVNINRSRFEANRTKSDGAAIYSVGNLIINDSTISGNTSDGAGGGIAVSGGNLTVSGSTLSGNIANGINDGSDGGGGGLSVTANAIASIVNSTITGNSAPNSSGGGIKNGGKNAKAYTTLINSTIAANSAQTGASVGNSDYGDGTLTLRNSLVAEQTGHACVGTVKDEGYNVWPKNDPSCPLASTSKTDDPALELLTDNGGPTQTLALKPTSVAIGLGSKDVCPPTDQRGVERPRDTDAQSLACAAGSYEVAPVVESDNNDWSKALDLSTVGWESTQTIIQSGGSKWFKIPATRAGLNADLRIALTGIGGSKALPANYDLTLYTDIAATFDALKNPTTREAASAATLTDISAKRATTGFLATNYLSTEGLPIKDLPIKDLSSLLPIKDLPIKDLPPRFVDESLRADVAVPQNYNATPLAFRAAPLFSLMAVSAGDGVVPRAIERNTWSYRGALYIRVSGRDGAFNRAAPFHLVADVKNLNCGGISEVTEPAFMLPNTPKPLSLILTDSRRVDGLAGNPTATNEYMQALQALADNPNVNGTVIDFNDAKYARVKQANDIADRHKACAFAKNIVADEINAVIATYAGGWTPTEPSTQYIVLAGGDDVIPYFRYPDLAEQGNERDYSPPVIDNGAQQAALRTNLVLSQDGYGSIGALNRGVYQMPLPTRAVGRLVSTPTEIIGMINAYNSKTLNGAIVPKSALVTGYDFTTKTADEVVKELGASLTNCVVQPNGQCAQVASLTTQDWSATNLRQRFLDTRQDMVFLSGHFSAGLLQAADGSQLAAQDLLAGTGDHTNSLVFALGCHSGYAISARDRLNYGSPTPDWAQAFSRERMTAIAGTGYQYGDTEVTAFSAQLYADTVTQLHTRSKTGDDSSVPTLGQALVKAKQRYLTTAIPLNGTHQKAVLVAALYGLPMLRVTLKNVDPPAQDSALTATPVSDGDAAVLGLATSALTVSPKGYDPQSSKQPQLGNYFTVMPETGDSSQSPVITTPKVPTQTSLTTTAFEPLLPVITSTIGLGNTQVVRGVGLRSATYEDKTGLLPATALPLTEFMRDRPSFASPVFYPLQPWQLTYVDGLSTNTTRAQLATIGAQYKADSDSTTQQLQNMGTLRLWRDISYRLFYSDNTKLTGDNALADAPTIADVRARRIGDTIRVTLSLNKDGATSGQKVRQAWITYTSSDKNDVGWYGYWRSSDLTSDPADPNQWTVSIPLDTHKPESFAFMVQAAGNGGLVRLDTNAGRYYGIQTFVTPVRATVLRLESNTTTVYYGKPQIAAALTYYDPADPAQPRKPLAGQTVTFTIGGQSAHAITDAGGRAVLNGSSNSPEFIVTLGKSATPYTLRAGFEGNEQYQAATATKEIAVTPRPTQLSIQRITTPNGSNRTRIVAKLNWRDDDNTSRSLGGKTVVFVGTANGQSYGTPATTLPTSISGQLEGQADMPLPQWPVGNYTICAYFGAPRSDDNVRGNVELADDPFFASSNTNGACASDVQVVPTGFVQMQMRVNTAAIKAAKNKQYVTTLALTNLTSIPLPEGTMLTFSVNKLRLKPDNVTLTGGATLTAITPTGKIAGTISATLDAELSPTQTRVVSLTITSSGNSNTAMRASMPPQNGLNDFSSNSVRGTKTPGDAPKLKIVKLLKDTATTESIFAAHEPVVALLTFKDGSTVTQNVVAENTGAVKLPNLKPKTLYRVIFTGRWSEIKGSATFRTRSK